MTKKLLFPLILFISSMSFIYGMASLHFKIFPYQILKSIKENIATEKKAQEEGKYSYYRERESFFAEHGKGSFTAVFVGDSLTDGAEWHELFPDVTVANRGISGDTIFGLAQRLDSIEVLDPKKIFIMIGINDLRRGSSAESVFQVYKKVLRQLSQPGRDIIIQSTLFVGPAQENAEDPVNLRVKLINELLQNVADESSSITYVDINSRLSANAYLNPEYTFDDLHLNGKGYDAWKNAIAPYLD